MIIAVSGKGGTGKTMVAAHLIRHLIKTGKDILAIDADPDSNLADALGVNYEKTLGDVREELKKETSTGKIPPGVDKWSILEYRTMEVLVETKNFDLLVMGRPEGSGCYCAVNTMLRKIIAELSSNYDYVVIDTEAGLEHLSRRTTQDVDIMLVVTDSSQRGIMTAKRIAELAKELEIKFKKLFLIINRAKEEYKDELIQKARKCGLEVIGIIPEDPLVEKYDMEGKPLIELPENAKSVKAVKKILNSILTIENEKRN